MKKLLFICLAAFAAASCTQEKQQSKPLYMWFDCEGNYATLSHPDSIRYYVSKIHDMGFTDVVVDVKSIMGETLYKSDIAPYMGEWDGVTRPENYDLLGYFIEEGHKLGMRVHGSLNVFAGGHNFFDRGIIYGDHADWQSQVYTEGKIVPISEIKSNYNGMLNPANPEVQEYELAILREFAEKYPDVDGIVFDRVRFDNITSDFSPLSKELFEAYAGTKVADYPGDILRWTQDADGKWSWSQGPLFRKWIEWRASVIKDFVTEAHRQLKEINPRLLIGDYTGAWYPTYYYVGVNWASEQFDPARYFDWATPEYRNTGYADLLDIYMTGLYYTLVTKAEVDKANGAVGRGRRRMGEENHLRRGSRDRLDLRRAVRGRRSAIHPRRGAGAPRHRRTDDLRYRPYHQPRLVVGAGGRNRRRKQLICNQYKTTKNLTLNVIL